MDDAAADEGAAGDRKRDRNDEDGFFDSLGTYSRTKAPRPEKPNPDDLKVSSRELNTQFAQGKKLDEYEDERSSSSGSKYRDGNQGSARGAGAGASAYGGPGHQWRMMKLRRVYEAAEEEGRDVKEVALERYGSRDDFDEARRERQFLDDQQQGGGGGVGRARAGEGHVSASSSGRATPTMAAKQRPGVAGGFMYSDSPGLPSRPQSRQSFRKPGEASAPSDSPRRPPSAPRRFQQASLETDATASSPSSSATTTPKPSTPIPSVFTPTTTTAPPRSSNLASSEAGKGQDAVQRAVEASDAREADSSKAAAAAAAAAMDPVALNKLSAKVMRAEMSGAPNAVELRERLERETERAKAGGNGGDRGQAGMQAAAARMSRPFSKPRASGRSTRSSSLFTPARPFRRSLVPQLPYFMVQWDHKGEKGYGHVIEDDGKARHRGGGEDEDQYEDEEEGQEFPAYFAAEVVGNVLDLEPGRWRKPRRMQAHEQKQRLHDFKKEWEPFDWTKMLDQQSSSRDVLYSLLCCCCCYYTF
ncbi:hypothetical protein L7F22_023154 [Adiantum nelumboides]|nr:hypothetical protein [Adiantum nelumboides]